jgi:hypothetical protein
MENLYLLSICRIGRQNIAHTIKSENDYADNKKEAGSNSCILLLICNTQANRLSARDGFENCSLGRSPDRTALFEMTTRIEFTPQPSGRRPFGFVAMGAHIIGRSTV